MRPCIALCVGQLSNHHMGNMEEQWDTARRQKMVVIVSEKIHTASLVHDDILDHAETRIPAAADLKLAGTCYSSSALLLQRCFLSLMR